MIDPYTHDLHGREVDGWYWSLLEDGFKAHADRHRAAGDEHAAAIADRLAATADDVPAEIVRQVFDLWSDDLDGADALDGQMLESLHGYPDATAYCLKFIHRMTGVRAS
jgi:hypothetical protein